MKSTIVEELPLLRAKPSGAEFIGGTGPNVGPGSYDLDHAVRGYTNQSRAPFNTTSERPPLSTTDPRVPGPGNYNDFYDPPSYADYGKKGITAVPFVSGTDRFRSGPTDDVPGPGQYDIGRTWPTKRAPRTYTFAGPGSVNRNLDIPDESQHTGPGYYNPNHSASYRRNPKAAHFAKYSSRDADLTGAARNDVPGPGSYDLSTKPRSLYANKPSSMFATNTKRSLDYRSDGPGPGAYESDPRALQPPKSKERFSAFGSSAKRFHVDSSAGSPGPGSYTGEIAPRRARPGYSGTAAFVSDTERFVDGSRGAPGPGSYDARLYPRHMDYGGRTPFLSTAPRFAKVDPRAVPFDEMFDTYAEHETPLTARRSAPVRPLIQRPIAPALGAEVLAPRSYDINYDWPAGTDAPKRMGTAPRFLDVGAPGKGNDNPGPGHYFRDGANPYPRGHRFDNSNWSRDVRFKSGTHPWGEPGNPGPGRYYHEATLIYKSHNATIGSDTTWLDVQNP